jgi:hypothetical protein
MSRNNEWMARAFVVAVLAVLVVMMFGPGPPRPSAQPIGAADAANHFHLVALASDNAQLIGPVGNRIVFSAQLGGIGAAPAYLKFYDTAVTPSCGVTAVTKTLIIPAASVAANGGNSNVTMSLGSVFAGGLGICVTAGIADTDDTAVAAATWLINIDWK